MRRRILIALIALPAILLIGDFFYWRLEAARLHVGFEIWGTAARSAGWDVRYGALSVSGWPDSPTLRVANLTVGSGHALGPSGLSIGNLHLSSVSWGADALMLRANMLHPGSIEAIPIGPHPLRLNDRPPIPIESDALSLRLELRPRHSPRSIDLDAVNLRVIIPDFGPVAIGHLSLTADLTPSAGRDQPAITFSLTADPVALPADRHWQLGDTISVAELNGVLNGPLGAATQSLAERATSWRDGGGSLELHQLSLAWGDARLDATATLALDEDLQPMGAGTGKIVGYDPALDALAVNGVITRSAAKAAKAVLALLATPGYNDQPVEVEVPMTLEFRTLSVRQVPLLRLPELDWPEK